MRQGKLASADIGKYAENGVLAGGGVDVDTVTSEPGEDLWFRLH